MASAVKWVSWVRFPLREFPELLLAFLVEEAGEVLLDAGFFFADDVLFFAGKLLPPISSLNQHATPLQGQAGKQVVPCDMFDDTDNYHQGSYNQGVKCENVQLIGGDNPFE